MALSEAPSHAIYSECSTLQPLSWCSAWYSTQCVVAHHRERATHTHDVFLFSLPAWLVSSRWIGTRANTQFMVGESGPMAGQVGWAAHEEVRDSGLHRVVEPVGSLESQIDQRLANTLAKSLLTFEHSMVNIPTHCSVSVRPSYLINSPCAMALAEAQHNAIYSECSTRQPRV